MYVAYLSFDRESLPYDRQYFSSVYLVILHTTAFKSPDPASYSRTHAFLYLQCTIWPQVGIAIGSYATARSSRLVEAAVVTKQHGGWLAYELCMLLTIQGS